VFGLPGGAVIEDPTSDPVALREGLVAAAVSFFLAGLAEPPAELEATQADVAGLVTSLASGSGPIDDAAAREALDAIDDGLPGDAVALRLQRLLPPGADPLAILGDRLAAVS
jgi:hypothetical protein